MPQSRNEIRETKSKSTILKKHWKNVWELPSQFCLTRCFSALWINSLHCVSRRFFPIRLTLSCCCFSPIPSHIAMYFPAFPITLDAILAIINSFGARRRLTLRTAMTSVGCHYCCDRLWCQSFSLSLFQGKSEAFQQVQ